MLLLPFFSSTKKFEVVGMVYEQHGAPGMSPSKLLEGLLDVQ